MSATNQTNNDEIDLLELFAIIWRGKWRITIPSLLIALLTFTYLSLAPTNYSVTLQITPLGAQEINDYAPLNNIEATTKPIYEGGNIVGYEEIITSVKLMRAVKANFILGADLKQAIEEIVPEFQGFIGSENEKNLALSKAASAFSLEPVLSDEDSDEPIAYEIAADTKRIDLTRKILRRYLELATLNIRNQSLNTITGLKKSISARLDYELQSLEKEIENVRQTYFIKLQRRILILREQAKIARALNLAEPSQSLTVNTAISTNIDRGPQNGTENLYKNGYKALEAEIKLLESRDDNAWRMSMPAYERLAEKRSKIKNDSSRQQLDAALAASPLGGNGVFTPANFDFENILVEPKTNKPLIMVLVTLLAGLLATLIVLGQHYIRNQNLSEI
ncbi:Wzz/FepE/Etk N-terminal domain-containing protein [Alphaproteobacteria bacterium]|nr:Wzz/FepE/Etk N-terminal domain-containing protein [Alphaproteobacteria bacterium]